MADLTDKRDGYLRAHAGLRLLESSAVATFKDPNSGYLDLLTEDGRLRLSISRHAAEDLVIDLQLFLTARPPASLG